MEIILKKDVEGVGFKDDIVTVKNGFGRNFLIPNGSAILATPSAKKVLAENIKQQVVKDKKIIDDANKLAKKISSLEIKVKAKVGIPIYVRKHLLITACVIRAAQQQ